MPLHLQTFSYRFAEQVLNSKLALKTQLEGVLTDPTLDIGTLSRPNFNAALNERFSALGWQSQPSGRGCLGSGVAPPPQPKKPGTEDLPD